MTNNCSTNQIRRRIAAIAVLVAAMGASQAHATTETNVYFTDSNIGNLSGSNSATVIDGKTARFTVKS